METFNPSRLLLGVVPPAPNPAPLVGPRPIPPRDEALDEDEKLAVSGGDNNNLTSKSEPVGPSEVLTSRETGSLRFAFDFDRMSSEGRRLTS